MRIIRGLGLGERGKSVFRSWVEGGDEALMGENGGRIHP